MPPSPWDARTEGRTDCWTDGRTEGRSWLGDSVARFRSRHEVYCLSTGFGSCCLMAFWVAVVRDGVRLREGESARLHEIVRESRRECESEREVKAFGFVMATAQSCNYTHSEHRAKKVPQMHGRALFCALGTTRCFWRQNLVRRQKGRFAPCGDNTFWLVTLSLCSLYANSSDLS